MNARTILAVDAMGEHLFARIVRAPFPVSGQLMHPLPLRAEQLPPLDSERAVLERGKMVRDALRGHQGISGLLDDLSRTLPHQVSPLFIQLTPSEAELINWEMLCDTHEAFVALDPRWPIARIVDPINAPQRPPCELSTPIRLMAVISALGIRDQRKEWELLRDAVSDARGKGQAVKLKVLVGDSDLHARVAQDIAGLADTEVGPVEQTPARLTQQISTWAPNILHFFCHGQTDAVGQSLELATAADHLQHAAAPADVVAGSVRISAQNLARLGESLANPWLLVLNCCSGAKAGLGLQSMATQVVSTGYPAVVAMIEPVNASDAYEFTRAFYPEAFAALRQAAAALHNSGSTLLEWTQIMYHARSAILQAKIERSADRSPEWSLPVLCVRGLDAQMFIRPLSETQGLSEDDRRKYRLQAGVAAQWLRTAGQQMGEAERRLVMQSVLEKVPRSLWPDSDGRFDHDDRD